MEQESWSIIYIKENSPQYSPINLHKLAHYSSSYRVCIKNDGQLNPFKFKINIASGIELMELHLLPNNTDAENLALEVEWVNQQNKNLHEMMNKVSGMKTGTQMLLGIVS